MKERSRFTEKERSPSTITLSSNGLKSESPHPLEAMVEAGSIPQIKAKPKTCNRLTMLSTGLGTHTTANESVASARGRSGISSRSSSGTDARL